METNKIIDAEKRLVVGPILVNGKPAYESFLKLSMERKDEVGRRLSDACNTKVSKMVNFINDQQVVLTRNLKDLDDVRLAMNCLDAIKEDSIEYVSFIRLSIACALASPNNILSLIP